MARGSPFHREAKASNDLEYMRKERLRAMRLLGESRAMIEMALLAVDGRIKPESSVRFKSIFKHMEALLAAIQALPDDK